MPLYMDFHKHENLTLEAVKTAHMADQAIQDKYGVKYHQFWVNDEVGSVFCLVEGPDAETCEKVHQMAHGNLACALTEVEPGFYEKMMGKPRYIDNGLVQKADGNQDLGYRTILVVSITGITIATSPKEQVKLRQPVWASKIVFDNIDLFNGRQLKCDNDDSIIGIFDDPDKAVACAQQIQQHLIASNYYKSQIIFRIGISASQPVTESGDFFRGAIQLAQKLSMAAQKNNILMSSLVKKLYKNEATADATISLKWLNEKDEDFLSRIMLITEAKMSDEKFGLNELCSEVYISRPQLYRKITSLTGRSPNDFVCDMRMDKAMLMLKQHKSNISGIAYEIGFNSPSYFSKCFTEKFGCTPSAFLKNNWILLLYSLQQIAGESIINCFTS